MVVSGGSSTTLNGQVYSSKQLLYTTGTCNLAPKATFPDLSSVLNNPLVPQATKDAINRIKGQPPFAPPCKQDSSAQPPQSEPMWSCGVSFGQAYTCTGNPNFPSSLAPASTAAQQTPTGRQAAASVSQGGSSGYAAGQVSPGGSVTARVCVNGVCQT